MSDEPLHSAIDDVARALTSEPGRHDLAARVIARIEDPVRSRFKGWTIGVASAAVAGAIAVGVFRDRTQLREEALEQSPSAQQRDARGSERPAVVPPSLPPIRSLVWVDRQGREEPIGMPPRAYGSVRLSPDGTRLALDSHDENRDVWLVDLRRRTLTRLTFDPAEDTSPIWTPDGRLIVFSSTRAGAANLFWQAANGSGAAERLTTGPNSHVPLASLPDGRGVVFREDSPAGSDLDLLRLPSASPVDAPLIQSPFEETSADVSPDGRWLAYASNDSGPNEVYVRPFPGVSAGRWQVSTQGGTSPRWSRDGRELFFMNQGSVISVSVTPGPPFTSSRPVALFTGPYTDSFDVSPDGRRFAMIKGGPAGPSR